MGDTSEPRLGLPPAFSKLGASCGSELPTGSSFICGRERRIASLTLSFQKMPDSRHAKFKRPKPDEHPMAMTNASVLVDGPRVWVESSCAYCRMMMFSTTVFDLRLIDDEGLAQQQKLAGLPATPLLRTPAAWSEALSGWETLTPIDG